MDFFKTLGQSLSNVHDDEAIGKQLTTLVRG